MKHTTCVSALPISLSQWTRSASVGSIDMRRAFETALVTASYLIESDPKAPVSARIMAPYEAAPSEVWDIGFTAWINTGGS
jgi:hypothetical protein